MLACRVWYKIWCIMDNGHWVFSEKSNEGHKLITIYYTVE